MNRRPSKVDAAMTLLESLMREFDFHDREGMKVRADALTSAILDSGMVSRSPDDDLFGLHDVVRLMGKKLASKVSEAGTFYRALSSYDYDDEEMFQAKMALDEFGPMLLDELRKVKARWSKPTL